ncbi:TolC family protein [Lutibacter sp.]|uniref:TolC family protein n=1 Tax=Lutibacter sp. TaxID=1925666 RepID=UPI0025C26337|nr:TolC family protein [Lutibacter sp.]MCF6181718.1 TolC family protein [Lutibacter sp.]
MYNSIVLFSFLLINQFLISQNRIVFNTIDSLFKYAENNSISIKTGEQQVLLAKWQKISAQAGLVNFKIQSSFSLTNNVKLPVTYFPSEPFGGEPGTFKEVTMGQQFIGNINFAPQIDIINPVSWTKLKSAKINTQLTDVNNLIVKKLLFESISASYYNIISLKEQIEITQKNLYTADTLQTIMYNKYTEGIVRQQDLNDATINKLSLKDNLTQLEISLNQQYYALKILCDIPQNTAIFLTENTVYNQPFDLNLQTNNQLEHKSSLLKVDLAKEELRANRLAQYPTISIVAYDGWQQNSNNQFLDPNTNWINSQYIGLKLSMPFPDIDRFTLTKSAKINKIISELEANHTKLQNDITNITLNLDYKKAYSQFKTTNQIFLLKEQNYQMALNQFNASILSSNKLLIAFDDKLISQLNYSIALANLLYTKSKIEINNSIK